MSYQNIIPAGCIDGEHVGDGAYVSNDGYQIWVSTNRDGRLEAVALDAGAIEEIVGYAKRKGLMK